MAIQRENIEIFMELAARHPVLDVRSPAEFQQGHIPGAISFPLFSDEERKIVGTAYKQQSREIAIKLGLQFFGPKMVTMVEEAERIVAEHIKKKKKQTQEENPRPKLLVHCWRGGMRSAGIAWLLDLYGFEVHTLQGGYKAYRNKVHQLFTQPFPFRMLGGCTGSGKTLLIQYLIKQGEHAIDLEGLAVHRGSAFGNLGMPPQPTQEMFENLLGEKLAALLQLPELPSTVWLEDESQRIGNVNIPGALFQQMRNSPLYFLDIPFDERLQQIVKDYGTHPKEQIIATILRIRKRLGGLETKMAVQAMLDEDVPGCFRILLKYYDKYYLGSLENFRPVAAAFIKKIPLTSVEATHNYLALKASLEEGTV
ncbi:MAG: tRNA 2-selenouridine(34) synthase MnmH [Sediminibacterium sp.]